MSGIYQRTTGYQIGNLAVRIIAWGLKMMYFTGWLLILTTLTGVMRASSKSEEEMTSVGLKKMCFQELQTKINDLISANMISNLYKIA